MTTPTRARDDLLQARSSLKLQQIISLVLGLSVIVLIFKLGAAHDSEKIVQQTPDGDTSRWISASGPSEAKMLDAAYWVAHLNLDIAPNSIGLNTKLLKPWIDPDNWDQLSKKSEAEIKRMAEMHATQSFNPTAYAIDVKRMKVGLIGEMKKTIGDVALPGEAKAFVFRFKQKGLLLYLEDWHETTKEDPVEFDAMKKAAIAQKSAASKP